MVISEERAQVDRNSLPLVSWSLQGQAPLDLEKPGAAREFLVRPKDLGLDEEGNDIVFAQASRLEGKAFGVHDGNRVFQVSVGLQDSMAGGHGHRHRKRRGRELDPSFPAEPVAELVAELRIDPGRVLRLGLKRKREVKDIVAVIPFAVVLGNLDGRVESKMLDKAFVPDLVAEPELELRGGTEAFRLVQADESERLEGLAAEADASLHPP